MQNKPRETAIFFRKLMERKRSIWMGCNGSISMVLDVSRSLRCEARGKCLPTGWRPRHFHYKSSLSNFLEGRCFDYLVV